MYNQQATFHCSQRVLLFLSLLATFAFKDLYKSIGIALTRYSVETQWRNYRVGLVVFLDVLVSHELPRTKQPSVAKENLGYLISCQYSALENIFIVQQPNGMLRKSSCKSTGLWSRVGKTFLFISSLLWWLLLNRGTQVRDPLKRRKALWDECSSFKRQRDLRVFWHF